MATHREKDFKDTTLPTSYFLFLNDLWMGKNQYNDLGSTITTFLSQTLLLQCHNNINFDNVYSKLYVIQISACSRTRITRYFR